MLGGRPETAHRGRTGRAERMEIAGYLATATFLLLLLGWHASQVNRFYLDEWFYAHGAEHIWENLPLGPIEPIAHWTRGTQRLYPSILSLVWGPFSAPVSFLLSHLVNAALLASAVWPAALLARRIVDSPALRVLAVALATILPWLVISANLLTENLAFPLFLWSLFAVIRAAERPTAGAQVAALIAIGATTTCRLNLGLLLFVLVLAVLVAEGLARRGAPLGTWLRGIARRRWPFLLGVGLAVVAAAAVVLGGAGLGSYSNVLDIPIGTLLVGDRATDTGRALLTILRALTTGAFVLPVVLGLAAGIAGSRGALGRDQVVPAVVLMSGSLGVILQVTITSANFGFFEERYAFYAYPPLALLAVASLPHLARLLPELLAGSATALLALAAGSREAGAASDNFFVAPAGVFWTRVVEHRLERIERAVVGWIPGAAGGWLLIGVLLAVVAVLVVVSARRTRVLLAAALALCVVAQASTLNYDYERLLDGTSEAPGGLSGGGDAELERDDWIDSSLPGDERAAIVPGRRGVGGPWGGVEREQMFNRRLDAVVFLSFTNAAAPSPPGYSRVAARLDDDGLATWSGPGFDWLVAEIDDPRAQYGGRLVRRSKSSPYGLWRVRTPARALWTAGGLQSDATVLRDVPVRLRFDRRRAAGVRSVSMTLEGLDGAPGAVRWIVTRGSRQIAAGQAAPGVSRTVSLRVPSCRASRRCAPVGWRLTASGPVTPLALPDFGAPGRPRATVLRLPAVKLRDCVAC